MTRLVDSLRSLGRDLWRILLRGLCPAWLEWQARANKPSLRFIPTLQLLEERNHPTDIARLLGGALPGMNLTLMGAPLLSGLESLLSPLPALSVLSAPSPADLLSASSQARPLPLTPAAGRA